MTAPVGSVGVFCGRSLGNSPVYHASAEQLGTELAARGVRLVYGAGAHGMMATAADAALNAGGDVLGVIPEFLIELEGVHPQLTNLVTTTSLHERKRLLYESSDAFVALPGGLGTMDEVIEIITWAQVGLHDKPVVIVNISGWADHLITAITDALGRGFAGRETTALFEVVPDVGTALAQVKAE